MGHAVSCLAVLVHLAFHWAGAAQAQTVEEAARTNLALAAQLCIQPGVQPEQKVTMFQQAGFEYRVDPPQGNSDTTYYFTAPAGTVEAQLYFGEMPSDCFATSPYVGVTAASAILDQLMPTFYPTYQRMVTQGAVDPATGQPAVCVRYEQPGTQIPHVIGVAPNGDAQTCMENGTSRIFDFYSV